MRGKRAARHINAEVMLLCDMIHQEGQQLEDGTAVISFGDLFQAGLAGGVERGSRTRAPISLQVSLSRLKCILEWIQGVAAGLVLRSSGRLSRVSFVVFDAGLVLKVAAKSSKIRPLMLVHLCISNAGLLILLTQNQLPSKFQEFRYWWLSEWDMRLDLFLFFVYITNVKARSNQELIY